MGTGRVGEGPAPEPVLILRQHLLKAAELAASPGFLPDAPPDGAPVLLREEKVRLWALWQRVLDLVLALDRAAEAHEVWVRRWTSRARRADFARHQAAFLAAYRGALAFIAAVERDPRTDAVLNDAVPEMGLPPGTYDAFKLRYLSTVVGAQFALLRAASTLLLEPGMDPLRVAAAEDATALWEAGTGRGTTLTAKNAVGILRKGGLRAWFPVQKGASLLISHWRLPMREGWLIRRKQLRGLLPLLRPGDVLLQRREWVVTNVGLPGFWTHAALFVGTPQERLELAQDAGVREWLGRRFGGVDALETCLAAGLPPEALRRLDRFPQRIVEAVGEGVIHTSLERSGACDGLAVLRPRLPAWEKARALLRAFHFLGRPYDFAFDFSTDSALVCSEVVAKSYEGSEGGRGLSLPITEVAGHLALPPNDIARLFDAEAGREDRQFDLVAFLDGREDEGRAVPAGEEEFRASWRRHKWHVFTRGESSSGAARPV